MRVSLDTNIWIFGLVGIDVYCARILLNLQKFEVVVPDQVREELERNLSDYDMKKFYQFVLRFNVTVDFALVPTNFIALFEEKGLKKGDAEIGAYCEWRNIEVFVSHNRDFLRGLSPDHSFEVFSPQAFCELYGL